MIEIPLTQGKIAFIDDDDYPLVSRFKWHAVRLRHRFYATAILRKNGKVTTLYLHRLVMGCRHGDRIIVDHKNQDATLDNQKSNLRIVTPSQNLMNAQVSARNTSGIKGVCWEKHRNRWKARVKVHGKTFSRYAVDLDQAKILIAKLREKYHGEFARNN